MGKVILVTGGVRSGKSSYGEELAKQLGDNIMYIATAIPYDDEMQERIKLHKIFRPSNWRTYEGYKDLDKEIEKVEEELDAILLDCVTVMITNLIFDYPDFDENNISNKIFSEIEQHVMKEFKRLLRVVKNKNTTTILVTNEIGWGVVPESKLGRVFRDLAGKINQIIAKEADTVYLLVSGIPMKIK